MAVKKEIKKEKQKFVLIQEALDKKKGFVALHGWAYREAKMKDKIFIILRDSSNIIQCVIKKDAISEKEWQDLQKVLVESSLELEGTIREDKRAPTGYEVDVSSIKVVGYSEPFPITKEINEELLLDRRHLWLRSRKMIAIMKIRSTIFRAFRDYYNQEGFYEYQSPILQGMQCEGGSTLFKVDYFGKPIFLAQTWQLYAEPAIAALERIYTLAPSFRAEKSKTSRHLTEYWHAEMEEAWINYEQLQDRAEATIKCMVGAVLEKNKEDLKILERDISKLEPILKKKFLRITYDGALKLLAKKGINIKWGKDLRTIEEDALSEMFDVPIILTLYPKEVKAFYMKEDPKNPKVVQGFDLIGTEKAGELVGASVREESIEKLKQNLKSQGEDPSKYEFYFDTRRYGPVPHAGFGLGMERVLSWICGLDNIKDAIAFPRTPGRCTP